MQLDYTIVQGLAPDSSSLSAAQKLATQSSWVSLHRTGTLLWGEAKGSGKHPYLVGADLSTEAGIGSKCSCPSRKFPCKHALGLMFLYVKSPELFSELEAPEKLTSWQEGRTEHVKEKEVKAAQPPTAKQLADKEKRRLAREKKMTDGLESLQVWLGDLIRTGLLEAKTRSYKDWDTQAARMNDAQLSGLALPISRISEVIHDAEVLTAHLGKLYLMTQAWQHRKQLSPEEQEDLNTALGIPLDKSKLIPHKQTKWQVIAIEQVKETRLTVRSTWLLGADKEIALLLDFAAQGKSFSDSYAMGQWYEGKLSYALSAFPLRAIFEEATLTSPMAQPRGLSLQEFPDYLARALAAHPWLERIGVLLSPVFISDGMVRDQDGFCLPLIGEKDDLFQQELEANTEAVTLFVEWNCWQAAVNQGAGLRLLRLFHLEHEVNQ